MTGNKKHFGKTTLPWIFFLTLPPKKSWKVINKIIIFSFSNFHDRKRTDSKHIFEVEFGVPQTLCCIWKGHNSKNIETGVINLAVTNGIVQIIYSKYLVFRKIKATLSFILKLGDYRTILTTMADNRIPMCLPAIINENCVSSHHKILLNHVPSKKLWTDPHEKYVTHIYTSSQTYVLSLNYLETCSRSSSHKIFC
jgi:hypothetical protein